MKKYLVLLFLFLASCGGEVELASEQGPVYYSASSSDGIFFTLDSQPDFSESENVILHLGSGLFRKYEFDGENISSSISYDGVVWEKENGARLELPKNLLVTELSAEEKSDGTFKIFFKGE